VFDHVLGAEIGHFMAGEVSLIVRDDKVRNTEAGDDVNPEELDYLLGGDL
jgi:uncharacterized cupin superfamily protein